MYTIKADMDYGACETNLTECVNSKHFKTWREKVKLNSIDQTLILESGEAVSANGQRTIYFLLTLFLITRRAILECVYFLWALSYVQPVYREWTYLLERTSLHAVLSTLWSNLIYSCSTYLAWKTDEDILLHGQVSEKNTTTNSNVNIYIKYAIFSLQRHSNKWKRALI